MKSTAIWILFLLGMTLPSSAAETCSEAIAHFRQEGSKHTDADARFREAGTSCMQTGIFIGPYTRRVFRGFIKK
jgi:hypothetical protein